MSEALRIMIRELGEDVYRVHGFSPQLPAFKDIRNTTWPDLTNAGLVEKGGHFGAGVEYTLTDFGWCKGLEVAGILDTPEHQELIGKFCAACKKNIEGRKKDAYINYQSIATEIEAPWQWLYNVITSNILEHHYQKVGVRWANNVSKGSIHIAVNFGARLL